MRSIFLENALAGSSLDFHLYHCMSASVRIGHECVTSADLYPRGRLQLESSRAHQSLPNPNLTLTLVNPNPYNPHPNPLTLT